MTNIKKYSQYAEELDSEVRKDILAFWMEHEVDRENGGFYGYIANDGAINKTYNKGCILNSRIMWTFSHAYRIFKDEKYMQMAKRAYDYMLEYFWDNEYSGLYWMVDYKGKPVNTRKQIYNIAFGIYGLTEYYMATEEPDSLTRAIELFRVIEKYSYDNEYKGYFEALTREWQWTDDMRLSPVDMNEKKSMNTHLHILEAYTNLYRAWKDDEIKSKLEDLINITIDHIIDPVTYHFKLFFDECWNSKSDHVSYGHDIEGSWLLYEAAEVLGNKALLEKVREISLQMAQKVYEEGLDLQKGGLFNEARGSRLSDDDKDWWPQAEAMVGFYNAYELSGKEYFLDASHNVWQFVKDHVLDKEKGEWFWKVSREGAPYPDKPKVEPWKCPYHNGRACFEIISRSK